MAAQKKPAKPASKTTKSSAGTAKKNTANKSSATTKQRKPAVSEMRKQGNQARAVVLFALAIFLGCLVLIKGDNLWSYAHDAVLGVFGNWAILCPILMIYIAVVTALDKPQVSFAAKIWMMVLVIILFCGAGFIFASAELPSDMSFLDFTRYVYEHNSGAEGGVIGAYVGNPLMLAAGEVGSKIIIVLLIFVALMLLTGTTLIHLFKAVKKPVDVVSDGIQQAKQRREERQSLAEIDIPLEGRMPDHPVHSDTAQLFPIGQPEKVKRKKSDKLANLQNVFGIREEPEEILKTDEITVSNENYVETEHAATTPDYTQLVKDNKAESTEEKDEAALDAEKATAEFLREHAESEKKEAQSGKAAPEARNYIFPPVTLLETGQRIDPATEMEELQNNGRTLVETLKSFGVQTKILDISRGPSVTRYELQPAAGVKISRITGLSDDIAMNLAAEGVRIEAPIPGKAAVGIEVPNKTKNVVRLREIVESNSFITAKSKLTVALGRNIAGKVALADLAKMPHILIAGTTGSGKSVCVNSFITSVLYKASPEDVRFLMIDPKVVELGVYNGIPHLLVPVVTDPRKATGALNWAVTEMLNRYRVFADSNVRDLAGYNSLAKQNKYTYENGEPMLKMPQIIIIIDELSDLMMAAPNEVEDSICRLAQMARAAGMHLVVATQRPSVDVVTGLIKANIPSRIAFAVSSQVDSRTILDGAGAEKLLGRGDMLFAPVGASKPIRIQGCFLTDKEIEKVTDFVKKSGAIDYDEAVISEIEKNAVTEPQKGDGNGAPGSDDPMIEDAIKCVVEAGQASTSLLQRRLRLGYARAGRLIDEMEQLGIVGPHEGSKPRQVLMTYNQWLEKNMQKTDE